ncbi:MAG TPA: rod shape-determining protein MreD, partial [Flavobacteriaceae bacterium]|nr:rod shape-determining protein MreD [Flavobacteriaceae bacterium]
MNNLVLTNIIRFVFVVLLQILVVNQINFLGYINPMIYIVWIILYPLREKRFYIITLSFLLGLSIDFFSDTGGIHAAASAFIAYIRLPLLKAVLRKSEIDFILFNLRAISLGKAFIFIANITLIHHL